MELKWTRDTVMCYKRKGKCKDCILSTLESITCNLKLIVKKLLKEQGLYNEEEFKE